MQVGLHDLHTVGRAQLCSQVLREAFVSAQHASLRWVEGAWELRDLGSRNGTFVGDVRIDPSKRVKLAIGSLIRFGHRIPGQSQEWELVDDREPCVMAVPTNGGPAALLRAGLISIPDEDEPQAAIFLDGVGWVLESGGGVIPVKDGQTFIVGDQQWSFCCPLNVASTDTVHTVPGVITNARVFFRVSSDEEHVELLIDAGGGPVSLGRRQSHYMLLTLARQRLSDVERGNLEHGWTDVDEMLRMLPDYKSASHLNVEICRLRKRVGELNVVDPARIVERRRGQLRLGVGDIKIERLSDVN